MINTLTSRIGRAPQTAPFRFHGGLSLNPNKRALAQGIIELDVPPRLILPLVNYAKQPLTPTVETGDSVKRGQLLAPGVTAPTSGKIIAIDAHEIIHPDSLSVISIVLDSDGHDNSYATSQSSEAYQPNPDERLAELVQAIENANLSKALDILDKFALSGLGGAGFPTAMKLINRDHPTHTLIINAAECEPEIACDEALMQTDANDIVKGIAAAVKLTSCNKCVFAIEDSKPLAIECMRIALQDADTPVELLIIPTLYPTGAESPLIECVTAQHIPHNRKPSDQGIVCINVATAHALWCALNAQPLDSRVISLGGQNMPNPCNVRARFGTTVDTILRSTGNESVIAADRIRAGGPLSGFDLSNLFVPIDAKTNCILAEPQLSDTQAQACIRCGQCADVCPARLLPQQLHWYAMANNQTKCQQLNLNACIECGCCDVVCPSSIKLTETFRYAKSQASANQVQEQKATEAEQRYKQREQRLEQQELKRIQAIEQRKQSIQANKQPDAIQINAALARARAKRPPKQPK